MPARKLKHTRTYRGLRIYLDDTGRYQVREWCPHEQDWDVVNDRLCSVGEAMNWIDTDFFGGK